jgi:MYXO-CTERM domain-containing protein
VSGKLGQDEPCSGNEDCRSGLCFDDSGLKYCSASCGGDSECSEGHHCRDMVCVRGARGSYGDSCRDSDDCAVGFFCAKNKSGQFCTATCDGSCPEGFSCTMVSNGKACLPEHSVVGGACSSDADCLSHECFEDGKVCTRSCTSAADCGPGLDCVRSALGTPGACLDPHTSVIAPPDEPQGDGDGDSSQGDGDGDNSGNGDGRGNADGEGNGNKSDTGDCSVGGHGSSNGALLSLLGLGLVFVNRRRRR